MIAVHLTINNQCTRTLLQARDDDSSTSQPKQVDAKSHIKAKKKGNNKYRGKKTDKVKMQASKGKAACKCDKIAATPTRGKSVEVTPSLKANEREQTKAKKIKKKGLEEFFGKGPRVQPPS